MTQEASAQPRQRSLLTTLDLPGTVALTLVTLAVAFGLVRAFDTWDPLAPLAALVVLAHVLSFWSRCLRIPATAATLGLLVIGSVVITVAYYRDLSWFGLPNGDVVSRALADARDAFGPFRKLVAPVDASPGFTVTFAVGLWLMAVFADLAAARSDAVLQGVLPHVATFAFSSVLLLGRSALPSVLLFVGSLVLLRLAVRSNGVRRATGASAPTAIWAAGLPMLAAILAAGLLLSTAAPTTRGGLIDLRSLGRGPKAREVQSPLVSLESLLGSQRDDILFRVRSEEPHYWRLTSLDAFDGTSWKASARYRSLEDESIDSPWGPGIAVDREQIEFQMDGLDSNWLPAPYAPTDIDAPIDLRYDDGSSSVFVADGESSEEITYTVTAAIGDLERADLAAAPSPVDASLERYLELPGSFSDKVRDIAESLRTGGSAYDDAVALEAYFRDPRFTYDREANYRGLDDPLEAFIDQGNGFCQQFATAFAAMARVLGIPSRVAVGFTYGERSEDAKGVSWTVRGRYAHAWPEVYLHDVGWVAFEPTTGRGNPDATGYSTNGVAQDDGNGAGGAVGTTTTSPTTTAPPATAVPTTDPAASPTTAPPVAVVDTPSSTPTDRTALVVMGGVVALLALLAGLVALRLSAVRRRRAAARSPQRPPATRVAESWRQVCRDLERVDVRARSSETPLEFARRASRIVEVQPLVRLGHRESDRRFRGRPPDEAEALDAEVISDEVHDVVRSQLDRRQRLAADLDLTPRR